jgi:aldehyde:ferredoxin oxidoreductase
MNSNKDRIHGYAGQILRVNLSTGQMSEEVPDRRLLREYIGGTGLGVRMMYDEVPPDIDPLGPDAKLMFLTGPVTATRLGTAGRYQICFLSPLTGILCDSSSGGHWGAGLKQAGYDILIIEGKAAQPVYLRIVNGTSEIRTASHLWGKDTFETQEHVLAETGNPNASVLCIGPAGENLVLYSSIMNDAARTAARGGTGAVMGSKNLKAIVVSGSQPVVMADPDGFTKTALAINKLNATAEGIATLRELGTPRVMDNNWPIGDIPVKNWSVGSYEQICTNLGGKRMRDTILVKHNACHFCGIGCSRWVKIAEGPYQMDAPGPEFETLGALGSICLIDDLNAVSYAAHLCNRYGLDTISCGTSIAFAMECFERGLLTCSDTGGIELTWGNKDAVIAAIELIAKAQGFGVFLGLGTRKMAEKIGHNTIDFAIQVKGLELPLHDPRAFFSWAASYATSPRGGCHLHGMSSVYEHKQDPIPEWGLTGFYPRQSNEGKGKIARLAQNWSQLLDSMVLCYFASFTLKPSDLAALLNTATDFDYTIEELNMIGDRINALYRAYNYRCGIRRSDDTLPARVLEPLAEGGTGGQVPDLQAQLAEFYTAREWELDGKPGYQSLLNLGLADVAGDLYT